MIHSQLPLMSTNGSFSFSREIRSRLVNMTRIANQKAARKLSAKIKEKGLTLVPLSMYLKEERIAKINLALAQGKNAHDRREALSERDAKRSIAREMRNRARG